MSCALIRDTLAAGIRSFGSGDSEKAIIQFGIPLTLITGQNGAGKTARTTHLCTLVHVYIYTYQLASINITESKM